MLNELIIRDINPSEISQVHKLISETFHSHVSPDYSSKGATVFLEYIETEKIEERLNSDWYIPECVFHTLEKEKDDIYEELIRMEREKLVWEI